MESKDRNTLRSHHVYLLHNMPLEPVVEYLYQGGIFTQGHQEVIYNEPTQNGRVSKMLSLLTKRGPNAFTELCNALMIADRMDIVYTLQGNTPYMVKVPRYRWKYIWGDDGRTIKKSDYWFLSVEDCRKMGEKQQLGIETCDCGEEHSKPIMVIEVKED